VDQEGQVAGVDRQHLPDPAHALDRAARERIERGVEGLHRHHAGCQRRLDLPAGGAGAQAAGGDLDLG